MFKKIIVSSQQKLHNNLLISAYWCSLSRFSLTLLRQVTEYNITANLQSVYDLLYVSHNFPYIQPILYLDRCTNPQIPFIGPTGPTLM